MSNSNVNSKLRKKACLILEDGTEFKGYAFGAPKSISGEVGEKI